MLVEREAQLQLIDRRWSAAAAGRGSFTAVTGEAGIGKTALLTAAAQAASAAGARVLHATGGELEHELAFAVVRQLLEPALRTGEAARDELFAGAAGLAQPVFAAAADAGPATATGVFHGLYWLCANLAEQQPLLLVVDDAHWADEASLRFVAHLARRVSDLPLLLLLGSRPVPPEHLLSQYLTGAADHRVELAPLSAGGVGRLVRAALPGDADDAFVAACVRATGGSPFLVTEALRTLQAEQVSPSAVEAGRFDRLRPRAVKESVLIRLARVGPDGVAVARAVAMLGPAALPRHVAALSGLPLRRVAELVEQLVGAGLLTATRPIEFVHPLVRSAVYDDAGELVRATDHKRAALLLHADGTPADLLAPHLLAAEPDGDPWLVHRLREAATAALSRGAPEVAAACLQRAAAEPPPADRRADVYGELGRCLGMANQPEAAADALRTAYELTVHEADRVDIAFHLGTLMIQTGRGAEAVAAFDLARAAAEGDQTVLESRLLSAFLMAMAVMEPPGQWIARLDAVAARHPHSPDPVILACLAFGLAGTGDRPAAETARLAELAAQAPLHPRDGWQVANFASAALAIADRNPQALRLLDRAIDAARQRGNQPEFRYLAILRSHTALYAGLLLEAEADGRTAVDLSDDASQDTPMAVAVLAEALLERGRPDEAQQLLTAGGLDGELQISFLSAHFVLQARGRLRLRQGRWADALADLHQCGAALTGSGFVNPAFAVWWRAGAALARLRLGEPDAARELAAEDLRLARRFGAPFAVGNALRTAALIEGGDTGLDLLAEAVRAHEGTTAPLWRARALADLGAALRRAGQRGRCQEPLREALDLATRAGAAELVADVHEELLAAGARPRRPLRTGPQALTASELRVARLAVAGASNRDIAQALFLSLRTVELHLTHAYRKLRIDSRQQLPAALAALPEGG